MAESKEKRLTYVSADGWVCYIDHKTPNILNALEIRETHTLDEACEIIGILLERLAGFEAIGTIEELRELKEKAEPKKPIVEEVCNGKYTLERFYCPVCKQKIISRIDGDWFSGKRSKYCEECGTAIDWE